MRNPSCIPAAARRGLAVVLVGSLAWASGVANAGDDDRRIQFAPGTDSASVTGTFREAEVDRFTLRAAAGQTMIVSVDPAEAGASVAVIDPGGTQIAEPIEPGAGLSVVLPSTGDYVITVGPGRAEVTSYTLTVRIPASSPPAGDPQRIEFAPGTDRATVNGSLAPGTAARYVLRAGAGQTMTLDVAPDSFAALTTIFGPDGGVVGAGHTTATAVLPVAGDYVVEVGNTGSTTDFALTVAITGAASPAPPPPAGSLPASL